MAEAGRGLRSGGPTARRSALYGRLRFRGGAWTMVAGAGVFGLGCGRLALLSNRRGRGGDLLGSALLAPVLFLVIGLLLLVAGPRLVAAAAVERDRAGRRAARRRSCGGSVAGPGRLGYAGVAVGETTIRAGSHTGFPPAALGAVLLAAAVLAAAAGLIGGLTLEPAPSFSWLPRR